MNLYRRARADAMFYVLGKFANRPLSSDEYHHAVDYMTAYYFALLVKNQMSRSNVQLDLP